MRSPVWRAACALAVVVAALTVSGCDTDDPTDPRTPRPTSTPLFDSDEEALAAAEEAYGRYVAVTDQIFAEGGAGMERLETVATGEQLAADRENLTDLTARGYRSVGTTTFDQVVLQRTSDGDGSEIAVYLCQDVTGVDVIDGEGRSVVSPERPDRVKFEVSMSENNLAKTSLVVSLRIPWDESC